MKYESMSDKCVSTRVEIDWGNGWEPHGLKHYTYIEWILLRDLLILGARLANVNLEVRNLT